MADSSKVMNVVLIGAAAYVAYELGWLSFLGLAPAAVAATSAVTTPAASTASAVPVSAPVTGANSLDAIFARMVAAAGSGTMLGVDAWNTYLASAANITPPDPLPLFTAAIPGFAREQLLSIGQYWAVMAPTLKSQFGLSGLGWYGMGAVQRWKGW